MGNMLTVKEVAERLKLSKRKVMALYRSNAFPTTLADKQSRDVKIPIADIEAYEKAQQTSVAFGEDEEVKESRRATAISNANADRMAAEKREIKESFELAEIKEERDIPAMLDQREEDLRVRLASNEAFRVKLNTINEKLEEEKAEVEQTKAESEQMKATNEALEAELSSREADIAKQEEAVEERITEADTYYAEEVEKADEYYAGKVASADTLFKKRQDKAFIRIDAERKALDQREKRGEKAIDYIKGIVIELNLRATKASEADKDKKANEYWGITDIIKKIMDGVKG